MINEISFDSNILRISDIDNYIIQRGKNKSRFLLTGFNEGYSNLDFYLGGLELGNNIIIGARPSVGKTALALELSKRILLKNKTDNKDIIIIFFTWEMSSEQIYYRLISNKLKLNTLYIKKNLDKIKQTKEYKIAKEEIDQLNLFLVEGYNEVNSIYGLVNNTRERFVNEGKDVDIVCIYDHSRLVTTKDKNTEEQRIFELLKVCNQIKKYNVLNIILSQLNRDYEKGLNNKYQDPNNTYLFGADAIQQFSDVTLLLHSPINYKCYEWECIDSNYNNALVNTNDKLFIHVSKNRNGMSNFNLCIEYKKDTQEFYNVISKHNNNNHLFKDIEDKEKEEMNNDYNNDEELF